MKSALKLKVDVRPDHLVKLPEEIPVGPAEIIVLVDEHAPEGVLDDFKPIEPVRSVRLSELVTEGRN
jgi:hypothetical protein